MEVDDDEILQRLFFKKFGRALPEVSVRNEVDEINFVIDLTKDEEEEMKSDAAAVPNAIPIIKTEPTEVINTSTVDVAKVAADRKERREVAKARKAITAFGKTLRKTAQIKEKEAPENVVADSNLSEDRSAIHVESVNPIKTAEQITAESNAEIEADQKEFVAEFGDIPLDEFDDESEFRLYATDKDDVIEDDDDAMINNV
jgi:hypothetical protein